MWILLFLDQKLKIVLKLNLNKEPEIVYFKKIWIKSIEMASLWINLIKYIHQ
jgi:hypothetical protein